MPQLDGTHVLVENAVVVWDAITAPEVRDDGSKSYKLKVVIPANSPDAQLVEQLAANCLQASKWKGVMPNGGNFAISPVGQGEYNDMFPGGHVVNPSTNRPPSVYDESGNVLDPMQYGAQLYPGQVVSVIVHCWDYDNKSKGIATGLDGIKIHASANAQRQQFGGGGYDAAAVFAGGAPAQQQQQQGQQQYGQQQQQGQQQQGQQQYNGHQQQQGQQQQGQQQYNGHQQQQGQQQQGQQQYGQQQQGQQQQGQQQQGQQQYGQQQQGQQQQGQQQFNGGPQQANNFLPNQ